MKLTNPTFYNCNSETLAKKLLGKILCVAHENKIIRVSITETESYGLNDTACHTYKGRTKRNDPMFHRGGTIYVYLCYGIHEILNISAGADGEGQGVMIRGVCATKNIGAADIAKDIDNIFGPGRVTKLLGVDRSFNYEFLTTSTRIWLEDAHEILPEKIQALKRVGIGYALQEDQDRLWRFRVMKE